MSMVPRQAQISATTKPAVMLMTMVRPTGEGGVSDDFQRCAGGRRVLRSGERREKVSAPQPRATELAGVVSENNDGIPAVRPLRAAPPAHAALRLGNRGRATGEGGKQSSQS